jgi:hypothetical protein
VLPAWIVFFDMTSVVSGYGFCSPSWETVAQERDVDLTPPSVADKLGRHIGVGHQVVFMHLHSGPEMMHGQVVGVAPRAAPAPGFVIVRDAEHRRLDTILASRVYGICHCEPPST